MTPVLKSHFADYGAFHRTPGNQLCHYLGIPLIVLTLFSLLSLVHVATLWGHAVTLAEVLFILVSLYYLTLDATLAVLMFAASGALLYLGRQLPWSVALGLFVLGWILQFVGHYVYEKRSPAFYRNLVHLLVGPLWILAKATGRDS
jgi:uncharacterized membrane protein YGL010W